MLRGSQLISFPKKHICGVLRGPLSAPPSTLALFHRPTLLVCCLYAAAGPCVKECCCFLSFYQRLLLLHVLLSRSVACIVTFNKGCLLSGLLSRIIATFQQGLQFTWWSSTFPTFFSYWVPPVPGSKGCFLKASWSFQQGLVSSCQHSSDLSCKASALLRLSSFNLS